MREVLESEEIENYIQLLTKVENAQNDRLRRDAIDNIIE
jgi:hypothetical protein